MKAGDLLDHLNSLRGAGPYPEPTVDTFKAGDPEAEVRGIAVGWMSYTWALERALALGCNVFVTHEPTYYDHFDADPAVFQLAGARLKRDFIAASGLVILRCHDVWDQAPGIGIADAWGAWLGLGEAAAGDRYLRIYEIPRAPAERLAQRVAGRLEALGQPGVQLIGPPEKEVGRVGIGTGAITPFHEFLSRYAVEAAICTDDGVHYWRDGALAIDLGVPLLIVNHAVSEEAGMRSLAEHLRAQFPAVPVHHIPQACMFRSVYPERASKPATDSRR